MRNLQGKLTWVIARPLLLAIWLFLPLSATLCHAQSQPGPCWNAPYPYYEPPYLPRITSGFPSTAGEGYLVTIQSDPSEPYFSNNNDCLAWMVSYENFWINGRYIEDPNAGVSNLTYISPTEIQLNVALAGNASGYEVLAITDGFYTLFWNIDLQGFGHEPRSVQTMPGKCGGAHQCDQWERLGPAARLQRAGSRRRPGVGANVEQPLRKHRTSILRGHVRA